MQIQVSPQLEALTVLFQKLGYKNDIPQLLNNCAYSMIRQMLGAALEAEGIKFNDRLKDQEQKSLVELQAILKSNIEFFKKRR